MSIRSISAPYRSNHPVKSTVNAALSFKGIRNPILDKTVHFLPWALLMVAIASITIADTMYTTGIMAAALSLLAFRYLMELIPKSLDAIYNRGVLTLKGSSDEVRTVEMASSSLPPALLSKYINFIKDFDGLINHTHGQWLMAIFFALLGLIIGIFIWSGPYGFGWEWEDFNPFSESGMDMLKVKGLFQFVTDPFIGLIIGFMTWRMVVTGYEVWKIGQKFDIVPKPRHPDNSGGLSPLGNLCLWNALIVTIPTIFLGGWILLARTDYFSGHGYDGYIIFFSVLLPIPIAFAFIGFFFPLWRVHQLMAEKKAEIEREQAGIWRQIDRLEHELLNPAEDIDPDEYDKKAKKLERMQEVYSKSLRYPVWPFNLSIILKFLTSQFVPILSLVVSEIGQSLGEPTLNITSTIVENLNKFWG